MRIRALLAAAAAMFCIWAFPAPAHAQGPYTGLCDQGSASLCARDPSSGGLDTLVKMGGCPSTGCDESMEWQANLDTSECGGFVENASPSHPACPSDLLADRYKGDPIWTIRNGGSGYCLGADADTGYAAKMKTCGEVNTDFITSDCNGVTCFVVGIAYSDEVHSYGWLCGSNNADAPLIVTSNCSTPAGVVVWGWPWFFR